jgi:hypothetical protein
MLIQGQVGQPGVTSLGPGTNPTLRVGQMGDAIVSELHGRYYETTYRRNLFTAYSAAQATSVVGTAMVGLQLWNASNSVNLVLSKCSGYVAVTSASTTAIVLASGIGQVTTPSSTTAITRASNNFIGGGLPQGQAYNAGTFSNAPTAFWPLLHNTAAIATTGEDPGWQVDFEGSIIVPPQAYVAIAAIGSAAASSAVTCALMWEEVPI